MGGNEYLIQKMIDRLIDTGFRYRDTGFRYRDTGFRYRESFSWRATSTSYSK